MPLSLPILDEDVLRIICSIVSDTKPEDRRKPLTALSLTDKQLRRLSLPYLFESISLSFFGDGPWKKGLQYLQNNSADHLKAISPYVRKCHILLELGYQEDNVTFEPTLPPTLASFLSQLTNLSELSFVVNELHASKFEAAFAGHSLTLPNVKDLVVGPYCHFLVTHTPNVETISTNSWSWLHSKLGTQTREHSYLLIDVAGRANNLKHFEMNEWWACDLLEAVHKAMPNIPTLIMDGGRYNSTFYEILPILTKFHHLKTLGLVDPSSLGVGFNPPWCGNAYMGPGGKELLAAVNREGLEASDRVANATFDALGSLEILWLASREKYVVEEGEGLRKVVREEGAVKTSIASRY